jgi:alpha-L-rhamnosidase
MSLLPRLLPCVVLVAVGAAIQETPLLQPNNLRVDGRSLPAYIDHHNPRFSWDLSCEASLLDCRGIAQQGYRITVRSQFDNIIVGDTGRRQDVSNNLQLVPRTQLQSDTSYFVAVSIWADGQDSPSTSIGQFHTALFEQDDWTAKWIGGATQMRASFEVSSASAITSASAFFSGLGCASLRLNGERATDSALDPGMSTIPTVRMLYRAVNVTALIKPGQNAVGMRTGMCKYGYLESYCTGANGANANCRGAILQLSIKFADGSTQSVTTNDGSWLGTTDLNPIRYTHLFHGEIFDARLDGAQSWDTPEFVVPLNGGWAPVDLYNTSADGIGELKLHAMPPIGVSKSFVPINITAVPAKSPSGGGIAFVCPASSGPAGVVAEGGTLSLKCADSGTIKQIEFASFGTPFYGRFVKGHSADIYWTSGGTSNGTKHHIGSCNPCPGVSACDGAHKFEIVSDQVLSALTTGAEFNCSMLGNCADFHEQASCASPDAITTVSKMCVGKTECAVPATAATFGADPCSGTLKELMVRATGCAATPPAPSPAPASNKSFIFDMGQNFAGVCKLKLPPGQVPKGTVLTLRHAEILHADGSLYNAYCGYPCKDGDMSGNSANQTDQYTASGDPQGEEWTPEFTYHGFRFVQLDGLPAGITPTPAMLTGLFTHSLVAPQGKVHFNQSKYEILNSIQTMVQYTQLSNLHSIPTDCPTREKRGWMGDAQWTAGEASLNFDVQAFYLNWLVTMKDTQIIECNQVASATVTAGSAATVSFEATMRASTPAAAPRRPPTYECCSHKHPTFGCDWTGTDFDGDVTGSLPDVVPYSRKTYGGWPGDPTWGVAAAVIPWEVITHCIALLTH